MHFFSSGLKTHTNYVFFVIIFIAFASTSCRTSIKREKENFKMISENCFVISKNVIDSVKGEYCIYECNYWSDDSGKAPANVPLDSIKYGMKEFGDISSNYKYFQRICLVLQENLKKYGSLEIMGVIEEKPVRTTVTFDPRYKHLIFRSSYRLGREGNYANSIDLSEVDTSIK